MKNRCLFSVPPLLGLALLALLPPRLVEAQETRIEMMLPRTPMKADGRLEKAQRQAEAERQKREAAEAEMAELKRRLAEAERKAQPKVSGSGQPAPAAAPTYAPLSVFRDKLSDGSMGPEMVVIPAGSFMMGSTAEEQAQAVKDGAKKEWTDRENPRHSVTIGAAFALGKTEVTVDEFRAFAKATGYKTEAERDVGDVKGCYTSEDGSWDWRAGRYWDNPGFAQTGKQPVVCVSWNDAMAYATWLYEKTGKRYRLPSEAEWEYAARAGTKTARYWGDADKDGEACRYANVADQAESPRGTVWSRRFECRDGYWFTAPVAHYQANAWGLYDMIGNVWEWVDDCWNESYAGNQPGNESARRGGDCGRRVLRGGSWYDIPGYARAANRVGNGAAGRSGNVGFRLARMLP